MYRILSQEAKRSGQGVLGGERPKNDHQGNARTPSIILAAVQDSRLTLSHLVQADIEEIKKLASNKLTSKYAGAVEF